VPGALLNRGLGWVPTVARVMGRKTAGRGAVRLLEVDPDLGADLEPESLRTAASELVAPVTRVGWARNRGRWGPADPQGHLGLLVVDGLLLREVLLLGSSSAEVLGEGDLLRPWDVDGEYTLPVPAEVSWTVLAPCEVAILNSRFVRRAGRWPEVLARLTGRTVGRAKSLALHDAVTNLKHVETRLLVQFWHLAERWGRVGPDGISIPVPLTHEMLAKLVGAARPSVTTGLGRLASRGLLVRESDRGWRLSRRSREALHPMPVQAETQLVS
jgi:CRP/FNR family transcriptional regulator, cyclic AMP receptor protein